jgi:ketosteroid isomerase-like protein
MVQYLLRRILIFSVLSCAFLPIQMARAQEWSPAQKEVWQRVVDAWKADADRDVEQALAYYHDEYLGWWNRDAFPENKSETKRWIEHHFKSNKVVLQNFRPLAIKIHGDTAIVHYYAHRLTKDAEGKEKDERHRWSEVWTKENGKWLLLSATGGPEFHDKE